LLSEALAKETNACAQSFVAQGLAAVAARLSPEEAARYAGAAARLLSEALAKVSPSTTQYSLAQGLATVAARLGPTEAARRSLLAARALAETPWPHPLAGLAALALAAQPLPSHFSTQELVNVLKWPTCVGPFREEVLRQLGNKYNRSFADQWEFVDFAEKHLPDVDLTTPPKRPKK
jgi:hypothetical protein